MIVGLLIGGIAFNILLFVIGYAAQGNTNDHLEHLSHEIHFQTNKINTMPTKADFDASFAELGQDLTNLSTDLTNLTNIVNGNSGGLSAEDTAAVLAQLQSITANATALSTAFTPATP